MIQAIDRAARVLTSLQGARHLGITDLAAELGLPPSTVHGIVASLRSHGLVAKEPGGSRYMLGPALLKLSNVYLDTLDVRVRARRWTASLASRTGLAVRLGVELFDEVIVIHHEPRPDGTDQMHETGLAIPAHASALGKVMLAYRPDLVRALGSAALRGLTGATIPDVAELTVQLAQVAERGLATEVDEAVLGEASVAAPIADRSGAVIAAVAVVLPSGDWPTESDVLDALRETARTVSRELGARAWPPAVPALDEDDDPDEGPDADRGTGEED